MSKTLYQQATERLQKLACNSLYERKEYDSWCDGYCTGVKDILARLEVSKNKMLETYGNLQKTDDDTAYHSALVVMAIEIDMILKEYKEAR